MEFSLTKGMFKEITISVTDKDTAKAFGSGGVDVYATPMMIGLMENAALNAVEQFLPEGYATVGINLNVKHLAATPIGMKVTAKAQLLEIDGKKLIFKVEAFDEVEKIGEGIHERFIISLQKFIDKANKKSK